MDETLVDIILILLAGLAAVSIMPEFNVEPPTSVEIDAGANRMLPLQVALTAEGALLVKTSQSQMDATGRRTNRITAQDFFDLVAASDVSQSVEIVSDERVSARRLIDINLMVQKAGRQAVFIVRAE